jgi:hypothetical protein
VGHRGGRRNGALSRGQNLPIPTGVERSRRSYFLLLGVASVLGWSTGLWAVPLVAFALLEMTWTAAEHVRGRGRRYVR